MINSFMDDNDDNFNMINSFMDDNDDNFLLTGEHLDDNDNIIFLLVLVVWFFFFPQRIVLDIKYLSGLLFLHRNVCPWMFNIGLFAYCKSMPNLCVEPSYSKLC